MATEKEKIEFINLIGALALKEAKKRGYGNAQIWTCIAQACDESAYGTCRRMREAFAPFGIKATDSWVKTAKYGGLVYSSKTHEVYSGVNTVITACFRAYSNYADAVSDYFDLLENKRYRECLTKTTVLECITVIKNGGYATAPDYINTICKFYKANKSDMEKYSIDTVSSVLDTQHTQNTKDIKRSNNPYIKNIQESFGVKADGIVGPKTRAAEPTLSVSKNNRHASVFWVQMFLRDKGYYSYTVDGYFRFKTESAVKEYQKDNNLTPDGIIGPKTWEVLLG